jgi:hypothetical protein
MKLDDETKSYFNQTQQILGEISLIVKPLSNNKNFFLFLFHLFVFVFVS